jgi:hypothetical protein
MSSARSALHSNINTKHEEEDRLFICVTLRGKKGSSLKLEPLVLVEPVVGVEQVAGNQSSPDCISVDARVDHLVFAHAQAEVFQCTL